MADTATDPNSAPINPTPYYGFSSQEWDGFTQIYKDGVRRWAKQQDDTVSGGNLNVSQAWTIYVNSDNPSLIDQLLGPDYKYKTFFQNVQDLSNAQNFKAAEAQVDAVSGARGFVKPGTIDNLNALQHQLVLGNNSYSGCDITPSITVGGKTWVIGNLSTISYSIHRDKVPVRTLGRSYAKSYVSGGVTIAGTLIFTVFDTHVLDDIRTYMVTEIDTAQPQSSPLSQQLPPFDVTIFFRNEYGHASFMRIYGLEITDEAQSHSINDIYLENQMQYVARDIDLMCSDHEKVFRPAYLGGNNSPTFTAYNMATPSYRLRMNADALKQVGDLQASNARIMVQINTLNDQITSLNASTPSTANTNQLNAYTQQLTALQIAFAANNTKINTQQQVANSGSAGEGMVGEDQVTNGSSTSASRDNPYSMTRSLNSLQPKPTPYSTMNPGQSDFNDAPQVPSNTEVA